MAAEKTFRERGYTKTKMEAIAAAAAVSVGTLYNHFQNKSDLLLTLVSLHDHKIAEETEQLLIDPPEDAIAAITSVFFMAAKQSILRLGRENWRHLLGAFIIHRSSELGERYTALNQKLFDRVLAMLVVLKSSGKIDPNSDVQQLGAVLFKIESDNYLELVANDQMSYESYQALVKKEFNFVLDRYINSS